MMWNGKELKTMGEIMDTIMAFKTKAEARKFMMAYRKQTPSADVNVGYMSVYYGEETAKRIMDWCEVVHPFFGSNTNPSVTELKTAAQKVKENYSNGKAIVSMVKQPEHAPVAVAFGGRVLDV